jgi:CO/xanthine dehydrogenase FAD-binding subunit
MKPAAFSYVAPETVADCISLLTQYSDEAKIIAGGQSLMPLLNLRMARPSVIVDIGRLTELGGWGKKGDVVTIGAMVSQQTIATDKALTEAVPILADAITLIGHPATRSRGTIVGSMCHADPAAELPVCAVLLGAEFVLRSSKGTRTINADEFFEDALSTAVRSDELVVAVRLPVSTAKSGFAFSEIARRHGDFALVSVGASVCGKEAKVAIGGAGPRPVAYRYDEFSPSEPHLSQFAAFGSYVAGRLEPNSDLHASAEYRRAIAATLVEQTLAVAFQRAGS